MLSVLADRTKLALFVILKRKDLPKKKNFLLESYLNILKRMDDR